MRAFRWRLQRVLEIRRKQEDAIRQRLLRINADITAKKRRISDLRDGLERLCKSLRGLADRWRDRELFLRASRFVDEEIDRLGAELADLVTQRARALDNYKSARRSRKTMERLREEAAATHRREADKVEQVLLEEGVNHRVGRELFAGD